MDTPSVIASQCHGRLSIKCNTFKEDFSRRFPTKTFPGPMIEQANHPIKIFIGNRPKIKAFREEEPKQTICIFVCAPLPWRVRLGEINGSIKVFFHFSEQRKFRAIIQRNAFHRKTIQSFVNRIRCFIRTACQHTCCR